jgi:hypothetical protein
MKKLLLLVALCVSVSSVQGQRIGVIQNIDARKTVSLDGQWQAIIDPYESGPSLTRMVISRMRNRRRRAI